MNSTHKHIGEVIISPRITEKGALLGAQGAYAFNVAKDATKMQIAEAVQAIYKVTPRKVTIVPVTSKETLTRGTNRHSKTATGKKAYVYLKKGDTIEFA